MKVALSETPVDNNKHLFALLMYDQQYIETIDLWNIAHLKVTILIIFC